MPETIEETAELVQHAGGQGIMAVQQSTAELAHKLDRIIRRWLQKAYEMNAKE